MQEHEPWEIGETRKKDEQLKGPSGMNGAETRAEFNSQWGYKSPLPRRDSLSTTTRVFAHSSHSSSTVLQSTAPFPHRITVLPPHLLADSPSYRYRIVPHRLSSPKYTESHRLPSFLTDTVLPHRYRIATRLAHRDSSVLPLSSITV